jgi:hypothetical protein
MYRLLLPDITFLATHPVTFFHRFGRVIVEEAQTTPVLL